jgi:nicotinamidase-related amidase
MEKKALVVIDVQNGMFKAGNVVHNGEQLLHNLKHLLNVARSTNTPIFYVQHTESVGEQLEYGSEDWKIHTEITPQDQDVVIQKSTPDSFFNTSLGEELKKQGIEHLFLTGIQTEICVDTTCRRAFSLGYKVTLVSDLHSTWSSIGLTADQIILHHNSTLRWFANVCPSSDISFIS